MKNFCKFKAAVTKPVIFENKLDSPEEMQYLLEEGVLDFASVGRKWIADPEWVNKAMYGKKACPCLRCNYCLHTSWLGKRTQCAVNPEMGCEFEGGVQLATEKKRVTVIGAGPGGIQAALTAAKRGHHVTLLEKSSASAASWISSAHPAIKSSIWITLIIWKMHWRIPLWS